MSTNRAAADSDNAKNPFAVEQLEPASGGKALVARPVANEVSVRKRYSAKNEYRRGGEHETDRGFLREQRGIFATREVSGSS